MPDLSFISAQVTFAQPIEVRFNFNTRIEYEVSGLQQNESLGFFTIGYFLSHDEVLGPTSTNTFDENTDLQLHSPYIQTAGLGNGVVTRDLPALMPDLVPTGNYHLIVVLDYGNDIAESNENNNQIAIDVAVQGLNGAPVIDGGDDAYYETDELAPWEVDLIANDPDEDDLEWEIEGSSNGPLQFNFAAASADADQFMIDPETGVLSFKDIPDFENPTDADGDNVYEVVVQVSDGSGGLDSQAISVAVTNVLEDAPDIVGTTASETLNGTTDNETILGRAGEDIIFGFAGNDTIKGSRGDDEAFGGLDNDDIRGGTGDDLVDGGEGNDALRGNGNNDTILGGLGNDDLRGGSGNDFLDGGEGNDTHRGNGGDDTFHFSGLIGNDEIRTFKAGQGTDDVLEIDDDLFADFGAVLAAAEQVGNHTVITVDPNNSITLHRVDKNDLHPDDFSFV